MNLDEIEGCTIIDLSLASPTENFIPKICPDSVEFKLIHGKCYAFENVLRKFDDTQERHSDLDHRIVSKKLLLRQNGLQLNRNCLEFIVRYVFFLSTIVHILIFRHFFLHFW